MDMLKRFWMLILALLVLSACQSAPAVPHLRLATTTSTQDSGLLDVLIPAFEQEYPVKVDVIAVGTGQALKLGEDGNADVLLVHDRAREDAFMAAGYGVRREDVMVNDFVLAGPAEDPAGVKQADSIAQAFQRIAQSRSPFISRGDSSGTHARELSLWKQAGINPQGENWYFSAGQGMGEVLTLADEKRAYTLSDRATFLRRRQNGLKLAILREKDEGLLNPYGVIVVSPSRGADLQVEWAETFTDWLISIPVQQKIAQFGVDEFGQSLFFPNSRLWREQNHP
ncbi:substrate-binding domain-containing protein [Anaerolinea thermophila]|uniref:Tungstate ABC transporter substrate binding protein n=1 Tax=Anaerolinea thermophila (strain DSM 14523 / JCM 11388 / NBRC 100420 / UNI-1) TaxID=926569 RepID=E8N2X4_ANATU|nr:tungstate ABC transporter substrate binding protein precursor [Anaerolinea thermophila UNI-1]